MRYHSLSTDFIFCNQNPQEQPSRKDTILMPKRQICNIHETAQLVNVKNKESIFHIQIKTTFTYKFLSLYVHICKETCSSHPSPLLTTLLI